MPVHTGDIGTPFGMRHTAKLIPARMSFASSRSLPVNMTNSNRTDMRVVLFLGPDMIYAQDRSCYDQPPEYLASVCHHAENVQLF
jgi:hypothetical protein